MIYNKYIYNFAVILLTLSSHLYGQFIEVKVELDLRRLSEGDRHLFNTMADDMENYFLTTLFSADIGDLELIIDYRLIIESISYSGSQTMINAQAIFTNKLDQYFYAKGVQFPYSKGQKIFYTPPFDPLASFLDYYAYMFIATELDTWEYMGGSSFYNKAIDLADLGKASDWAQGWDNRRKKTRKIKNNHSLRSMRFNYFLALYEISVEKVDINRVYDAMNTFYEDLQEIDNKLGSNKETLKFLDAYHKNISELLAVLKMSECLKLLMHYDHDNNEIYKSYLEN